MSEDQIPVPDAAVRLRARLLFILAKHQIRDRAVGLIDLVNNIYDGAREVAMFASGWTAHGIVQGSHTLTSFSLARRAGGRP